MHMTCVTFLYSYCPGGPDSDFEYSTQSYTGYEVHIVSYCDVLVDVVSAYINESY